MFTGEEFSKNFNKWTHLVIFFTKSFLECKKEKVLPLKESISEKQTSFLFPFPMLVIANFLSLKLSN